MASVLAITVTLCLCTHAQLVWPLRGLTHYSSFVDRSNLQLLRSKREQEWEEDGTRFSSRLNVCLFFSELQTCFHEQVECIKVVLVSSIKITSLKKHKQTAGNWSVSKVARQTGSFGSSYQEGKQNSRNKRPNNREFLVLNTDCQLFTAGSRAMDIPEVLCKWITCHL